MAKEEKKEEFLTYKERLLLSPEEQEEKGVKYAVKRAKLSLQGDIVATEESLEEAKSQLEGEYSRIPFDSVRIIDAQQKVERIEEALERLNKLEKELF